MATAGKEKKGAGLTYGMVHFAGSRQAPGPSEAALARLRSDGLLREDETVGAGGPAVGCDPPTSRVESTQDTAAGSPNELELTSPQASSEPAARATSKPTSPRPKAQRSASGTETRDAAESRPRGRRIQPRSAYTLKRTADASADEPARSVHFRLPALVDRYIAELAAEYECSRTHVVCALVVEARERRARGRRRRGGGDESPPTA